MHGAARAEIPAPPQRQIAATVAGPDPLKKLIPRSLIFVAFRYPRKRSLSWNRVIFLLEIG